MLHINVDDDDDDCLAPPLHSKVVPCTGWLRSIRRRQRLFPASDLIEESECHHLSTSVSLRKSVPNLTPGNAQGLSRFKICMEGLTKKTTHPSNLVGNFMSKQILKVENPETVPGAGGFEQVRLGT